MKYSTEDRQKHLILMCRFYDGTENNVFENELKAAEVDKSHLPPPECMKEEYKLSPKKVIQLKNAYTAFGYERFCRLRV